MKKFISVILAISMIATLLVVGITVNAAETGKVDAIYTPEGTAITSAADFAAMTADGKYYLANDITVDATYANAFTGTFDGNGKTVTTTAPLFSALAGTVKNVTVNATIAETTENNAIIAVQGSGDITFENVHTTGTVVGGNKVAAFLAYGADGTNVTLKNCVNDAEVKSTGTSTSAEASKTYVGGFVSFINGVTNFSAENCTNNGAVTSEKSYGAGIVSVVGVDSLSAANAATVQCTIKNCTNNGKITGNVGYSAGIVSYSLGVITIEGCVNNGDVENATANAAGILGSTGAGDYKSAASIKNCENHGKITSAMKAAGISVYFGRNMPMTDSMNSIESCANYGDIYLKAAGTVPGDGAMVAGIIARNYMAKTQTHMNVLKNCLNAGDIYVDMTNSTAPDKTSIGGIAAYTIQAGHIIANNINIGNISITNRDGIVYASSTVNHRSASKAPTAISNNYGIAIENIALADTQISFTFTDDMVKEVSAAQVASGELVYTLNTAAGATVFYQDLATGKITTIAAEDGSNLVIKNADGTYSNPAPVSGPQAIKNADDFANMLPNGEYYLDADITISASYVGSFTGILDGKNHTITTTAPLFESLAGTVKNLTVNGEIAATDGDSANVAITTSGDVTFENIVTNANILGAERAGSLIADSEVSGTTVTIKNCTNNADIIASQHAGGFVGRLEGGNFTLNVDNCVNNGEIRSSALYAAGITSIAGTDKLAAATAQAVDINISNCTNTGDIFGYEKNSAGIIGYAIGVVTIDSCVNKGNITNTTQYASGIFGSSSYEENKGSAIITNCENHGTITGSERAAGIASYFGRQTAITGHPHTMTNCANYGEIRIDNISTTAVSYASGIAAYAFGGIGNGMSNCLNAGNIVVNMTNTTKNVYVAGHIGYVNSAVYTFNNNVNIGNITVTGGDPYRIASTIVNVSTKVPTKTENNYTVNNNVALAFSAAEDFTYTDAMVKSVTEDQVKSGELVYTLNAAAGETIFYQDLANNGLPTLKANDAHIVNKTGDVYHNGAAPSTPEDTEPEVTTPEVTEPEVTTPEVTEPEVTTPEVTEPEVTTPEVTEPESPNPPTSDNGMTAIIISSIAILSIACTVSFIIIKKKEN